MMLFRNKGEIKETADFLENLKLQDARYKSLNIVSREAFNLNSSVSVNMIICALRYLHDNEDKQSLAYVMFHYYNEVLGLAVGWSTIFAQMNCSNGLFAKSESLPDFPLMDINQDMLFAPPLYDLIEKIIKKILYKDAQRAYLDDIYLTSFLDEVMIFLESHSGDIGEFIEYWNNEISKHTIPASESNAIEVMTIHKSKGLERDVVVIPFCDWEWSTDRHSSIEWCKPTEAPYNAFSSLPIRRKKIMADSIYKQDYYEEHSKQYVDNLNLLYVAFTRAKNEMYVYGIKDKDKSQRVSSLLNDYETQNLETPETPVQSTSNINSISSINVPFCSHDSQITFRQSNESKNFLEDSDDDTQDSYIKQGTLLHTIYSMINKKDDADKVVTEMFNIGVINADEKSKISKLISRGWQNKQVSSWFDGSWNISNECTILTKDNHNKTKKLRPDRVMTKNDETIVIDFKFGKPNDNYKEQVSRYMRTLTLMGYPNVSGYLWYVYDNKIEQV